MKVCLQNAELNRRKQIKHKTNCQKPNRKQNAAPRRTEPTGCPALQPSVKRNLFTAMAAMATGAAPPSRSCPGLFRHSIEYSCDFDSATCRPVKAWVRIHGRDPRVSNRIVNQMGRTPAARRADLRRVLRCTVHDPFERSLARRLGQARARVQKDACPRPSNMHTCDPSNDTPTPIVWYGKRPHEPSWLGRKHLGYLKHPYNEAGGPSLHHAHYRP